MEKLELEFYKTKKFIFGILFLILLACVVTYNETIQVEFGRYKLQMKYDLSSYDTGFHFPRSYLGSIKDPLGDRLSVLASLERSYLSRMELIQTMIDSQKENEIFLVK